MLLANLVTLSKYQEYADQSTLTANLLIKKIKSQALSKNC